MGSSPTPSNIFSIYLNEELNQMENNNNKNNNKNSSNSLVFGRLAADKNNEKFHSTLAQMSHLSY